MRTIHVLVIDNIFVSHLLLSSPQNDNENRSLVQIKSHAQKVLKRQDAGENVFRRLEEHAFRLDGLIKAVFDEQGIRADHMIPQPSSSPKKRKSRAAAAKKKATAQPCAYYPKEAMAPPQSSSSFGAGGYHSHPPPPPPQSHAPYPPASYPPSHGQAPYPPHGPRAYSPMFDMPHAPHESRAYSPHLFDAPHPHAPRTYSPYPMEPSYSHAPHPHAPRPYSPPLPEAHRPYSPYQLMEAPDAYSPAVQTTDVSGPAPPKNHKAGHMERGSTAVAAAALCQLSCAELEAAQGPNPVTLRSDEAATAAAVAGEISNSSNAENGRNSSLDNDSTNSSLDGSSIPSRQVFFPVDPDPAILERSRNVVSP